MSLPNFSRIEQETTITFNALETTAQITTFHPGTIAKLEARGHKPDRNMGRGRVFIIPRRCISIRALSKAKRQANPNAIAALRAFRASKKAPPSNTPPQPPEPVSLNS